MKKLIKNIFLTAVTVGTISLAGSALASDSNLVVPITPPLDSILPMTVPLSDIVHPGKVCTQADVENIISTPQISSLLTFVEPKALTQIKGIADQVADVLRNPTSDHIYDSFHVAVRTLAGCENPTDFGSNACSARALFALSDGTVLIDTARDIAGIPNEQANNVTNALINKSINENHASRISIRKALGEPCGLAYETKFSTTELRNETYLSLRVGEIFNSLGVFRFSTNVATLPIQD